VRGFVLPVVLLLLVMLVLGVSIALKHATWTSNALAQQSAHMQLILDAKAEITLLLAKITGQRPAKMPAIKARILSTDIRPANLKLCESAAYWLDVELTWQKQKQRVSSRWAMVNNAEKICAKRQAGWQQTQWMES
jgi:hypothetical protein